MGVLNGAPFFYLPPRLRLLKFPRPPLPARFRPVDSFSKINLVERVGSGVAPVHSDAISGIPPSPRGV